LNEFFVFQVAPALFKIAAAAFKRFSSASASRDSGDEPLSISSVIGEYITLNDGLAAELKDLQLLIQNYVERGSARRPLNILLAAEPGNGKSFLIKQLAGDNASFEEFHVGAFRTIDDLFGVLQRVQSANLKGKVPFVLFDEIDAKVDGRYVLANFLAPMWDGAYFIGKDSVTLGRAVFFFAASAMVKPPTIANVLTAEEQKKCDAGVSYAEFSRRWRESVMIKVDKSQAIDKRQDFLDRIDRLVCLPPVHEALTGDRATLERVQLACKLVTKHFNKVVRVERAAALTLAKKLAATTSRRPAESSVFCSRVRSAQCFSFGDLPTVDQERYGTDTDVVALKGKYYRLSEPKKKSPPAA
jgi:hypothetical protein